MPSDAARVGYLELFKANGYLDRLLIAQDIHTRHRLVSDSFEVHSLRSSKSELEDLFKLL